MALLEAESNLHAEAAAAHLHSREGPPAGLASHTCISVCPNPRTEVAGAAEDADA